MSDRTDVELLAATAERDVAAFEEMYDRHAGRLYALCRRILPSVSDAEEALQDAFFQVWLHARRFDATRGSVVAWLLVLARSRAIDRLRASRGQPAVMPHDVLGRPGHHVDPEREVTQQESASHLRRHVDALPAAQRVPLELAFYEGLTHVQVAAVLQQPLGTIKTHIRLALLSLRQRWRHGGHGRG